MGFWPKIVLFRDEWKWMEIINIYICSCGIGVDFSIHTRNTLKILNLVFRPSRKTRQRPYSFITGYNQSVTGCGSQRRHVVVTQRKLISTAWSSSSNWIWLLWETYTLKVVFVENHNMWRFDCTQCLLHFKNLKKQDEKMHFHTKLFFKCLPYLPHIFQCIPDPHLLFLGLMNNCWFQDTCITHSLQIRSRVPPWHASRSYM